MSNEIAVRSANAVKPIIPEDFNSVMSYARMVSESGMAPSTMRRPEQVAVAIMHGFEVGFTPLAALQSIAVINGRPSIWGDGALALCQSSNLMEDLEEIYEGEGDNLKAICRVKRKGNKSIIIGEFSIDDAKKANLIHKDGPWKQYPKRMLKLRARAFALRDAFADVFRGLAIAEEMQDASPASPVKGAPTPPKPADQDQGAVDAEYEEVDAAAEEKRLKQEKAAQRARDKAAKDEADAKQKAADEDRQRQEDEAKAAREEAEEKRRRAAANDESQGTKSATPEDIAAARLSRLKMNVRELAALDIPFEEYAEKLDKVLEAADTEAVLVEVWKERRKIQNVDEKNLHGEIAARHKTRVNNPKPLSEEDDPAAAETGQPAKPKGWSSKMHDRIDDYERRGENGDVDWNPDEIFDIADEVKEMETSGKGTPEAIAALKKRCEEIVDSL